MSTPLVFSFWKPDPVPPKNNTIMPIELHALGTLSEVKQKLFEVPHLAEVPTAPWEQEEGAETLNLKWTVEEGVILKVRAETGPPSPGEVLTIGAQSSTEARVFYRLYVQLFEQFGVTLFDERDHDFLTPKEFRSRRAG